MLMEFCSSFKFNPEQARASGAISHEQYILHYILQYIFIVIIINDITIKITTVLVLLCPCQYLSHSSPTPPLQL